MVSLQERWNTLIQPYITLIHAITGEQISHLEKITQQETDEKFHLDYITEYEQEYTSLLRAIVDEFSFTELLYLTDKDSYISIDSFKDNPLWIVMYIQDMIITTIQEYFSLTSPNDECLEFWTYLSTGTTKSWDDIPETWRGYLEKLPYESQWLGHSTLQYNIYDEEETFQSIIDSIESFLDTVSGKDFNVFAITNIFCDAHTFDTALEDYIIWLFYILRTCRSVIKLRCTTTQV